MYILIIMRTVELFLFCYCGKIYFLNRVKDKMKLFEFFLKILFISPHKLIILLIMNVTNCLYVCVIKSLHVMKVCSMESVHFLFFFNFFFVPC